RARTRRGPRARCAAPNRTPTCRARCRTASPCRADRSCLLPCQPPDCPCAAALEPPAPGFVRDRQGTLSREEESDPMATVMNPQAVEKPWLKSYPPGVPAEVNLDEFANIGDILHRSCER